MRWSRPPSGKVPSVAYASVSQKRVSARNESRILRQAVRMTGRTSATVASPPHRMAPSLLLVVTDLADQVWSVCASGFRKAPLARPAVDANGCWNASKVGDADEAQRAVADTSHHDIERT